jgi:Tfp pilus assembly protein PilN
MSTLNLVPWRERQRLAVFRRWQVGVVLVAIVTTLTLLAIDHALGNINQAHEARLEALHGQQLALQQQLTEAALWQTRERQAKQLQQAWPRWQQLQLQAWQALTHLLSVVPRGVQVIHAEWREGQWRLQVRALHWQYVQRWQTQLQARGVHVRGQPTVLSRMLWRCPQGRLWRLNTYELVSSSLEGTSS